MTQTNTWNLDLMKELELDSLPLETQRAMIDSAGEALAMSIFARAIPLLDAGEKDEFDAMLTEKKSVEEIETFLRKSINDFDKIVLEEVAEFKEQSVNLYKALE